MCVGGWVVGILVCCCCCCYDAVSKKAVIFSLLHTSHSKVVLECSTLFQYRIKFHSDQLNSV